METKHTPGPWTHGIRKDGSIWLSIGDPKTGPHFQADLNASAYDAKLICAAPDLLDALLQAKMELEQYEEDASGERYNSLRINAAIAKATGDENG